LPARAVDVVRDRLERGPDLLARGVELITHGVLDNVVDEFLPMVDQVDELVNALEEKLFERYDEQAIKEIFQIKRLVVQLRRYLGPMREVLNILTNRPHACIQSSAQIYFRDVYDHTIRIVESLESVRDLVATVLDTYLTQASNRLNRVMKSLSVVGTISLPLVVVGGMFGMNFHGIPFAQSAWGFAFGVALQVVLALAVYWYIRRRGWT
jgi:magnesium transporter